MPYFLENYFGTPSRLLFCPGSSLTLLADFSAYATPEGTLSTWAPVTAEVPQDSVLGPLLFAFYINDLRFSLKHCSYILYADDLQIYIHFPLRDLETALNLIREDIAAIEF